MGQVQAIGPALTVSSSQAIRGSATLSDDATQASDDTSIERAERKAAWLFKMSLFDQSSVRHLRGGTFESTQGPFGPSYQIHQRARRNPKSKDGQL